MTDLPKISVVVPSYNQGQFLGETLKSVANQHYLNLELIVMDGGSTDNSVDIIRKYEDLITYWVSEPDKGQTDALIRGFERATGDIYAWLNTDDVWSDRTLKDAANYFQTHPQTDAVFGDCLWIDEGGRFLARRKELPFIRFMFLYCANNVISPSMFWRSEIYKRVGGLDPSFDMAMDGDLWIRFHDAGARIDHVNQVWSSMRYHNGCKTMKYFDSTISESERILQRYHAPHQELSLHLNKKLAKALRIALKITHGCYGKNLAVWPPSRYANITVQKQPL
jgi:glycosyltransferase involved in cell wall biosynthesis